LISFAVGYLIYQKKRNKTIIPDEDSFQGLYERVPAQEMKIPTMSEDNAE